MAKAKVKKNRSYAGAIFLHDQLDQLDQLPILKLVKLVKLVMAFFFAMRLLESQLSHRKKTHRLFPVNGIRPFCYRTLLLVVLSCS